MKAENQGNGPTAYGDGTGRLRGAVADPPYIGQSKKHYEDHPDYAGEVDHEALIERLRSGYDCWALCLHSPATYRVLDICERQGLSLYDGDIRPDPSSPPSDPEGERLADGSRPYPKSSDSALPAPSTEAA